MAEKLPLPNTILLYLSVIDGDEAVVVCLTQNDMSGTSNNSTIDTFCGTEQLPGSQSQTITGAFRRIWGPDAGRISEAFCYDAWKDKTHLEVSQKPLTANLEAGDIVYQGTGYITAYGNQNGTNAIPTASMTISLDVPMTRTDEPS